MMVDYAKLADSVEAAFVGADVFIAQKHVAEFIRDGEFLGDYFNFFIMEPNGAEPPRFYHVLSPFDVISKQAPQLAVVFENGDKIYQTDFTEWVGARTGVMDAIVARATGKAVAGAKILYIGTGQTATHSLQALKVLSPGLTAVDYQNTRGTAPEFEAIAARIGVTAQSRPVKDNDFSAYDMIFCHTNATKPVIRADAELNPAVLITTYITSADNGEVADELYDNAQVIVDWRQTVEYSKDLMRAVAAGAVDRDAVVDLQTLLTERPTPADTLTIFRSSGTPIQNVAVLKMLLAEKNHR